MCKPTGSVCVCGGGCHSQVYLNVLCSCKWFAGMVWSVDLQAMLSECQNLALKKAGQISRVFGEESECFLIGYLTVCSSHAKMCSLLMHVGQNTRN